MRFEETAIKGARAVLFDSHSDARGSFARIFCEADLAAAGIPMRVVQANISRNPKPGTLRGMHYQAEPHGEDKIVQCVQGRIFDVAVDLRPTSPTYRKWAGMELSPDTARAFFIPRGCAHGFITLEAGSDVLYLMGQPFVAGTGQGVRWNDPAFAITWPTSPLEMSDRDANYPDYA